MIYSFNEMLQNIWGLVIMIVGDLVDPLYAQKTKIKKNFNICISLWTMFRLLGLFNN